MRKFSYSSRRRAEGWLLRGLLMLLAGVICGGLLGNLVAGSRLGSPTTAALPFSQISANPDAAAIPAVSANPCLGCPDSYGVAARMRAERANRTNHAFRALGAVDPDAAAPRAEDDYQYGGRFPDIPTQRSVPARPDSFSDTGSGQNDGEAPAADAPDL